MQAVVVVLVFMGWPAGKLSQRDPVSFWTSLTPPTARATVVVFGPEDFLRRKGKPVTIVRTFSVADPSGAFTLCIDNGVQAGSMAWWTVRSSHSTAWM